MGSWLLFLLFVVGALLFRRHGNSWRLVIAKLAALTVASIVAVLALSGLIV